VTPRLRGLLRLALLVSLMAQACGFDSAGIGGEGGALGPGDGASSASFDGSASSAVDDASASTTPSTTQTPEPDTSGESSGSTPATSDTPATTDPGGSSESTDGAVVDDCPPDWWDVQWTHRRRVGISGELLAGTDPEPVVLLRLGPQDLDYMVASDDGDDLRFVVEGAELAYEIETWDVEGRTTVWLRLPALPQAGTSVAMYWGNPAAAPASDGAATWPDSYISVHHLGDEADATGIYTAFSSAPPAAGDGVIGQARDFDGVDDFLELPTEADFDFTTAFTVEAWIRVEDFDAAWQAIVTKGDTAWRLHRNDSTSTAGFGSNGPAHNLDGALAVDDGNWHSLAIVYGDGVKRLYVDGVQDVEATVADTIATNSRPVQIGANDQHGGRNFNGRIDEVRISSVARTPESIAWHHLAATSGVDTIGLLQICD